MLAQSLHGRQSPVTKGAENVMESSDDNECEEEMGNRQLAIRNGQEVGSKQ
jgi:hypothetical protein